MVESSTEAQRDALRERFIQARVASGLTQEQAAKALGISTASVSRKERGEQPVTMRDVAAMERTVTDRGLGTVSRGTSGDDPRLPWNRAVNGPKASEWRRAFRQELQALGATPDEEDNAVDTVRASGEHTYNAQRLDWTEDEAIQAMEVSADSFRRYFAAQRATRSPRQTDGSNPDWSTNRR